MKKYKIKNELKLKKKKKEKIMEYIPQNTVSQAYWIY